MAIKSISLLLQKSRQQKHKIRTGIGKLWSVGQIQLTSYFCSAYNLRILFIFLDHPKRWKRRLWHENSMKFKFQCPWVVLLKYRYYNLHTTNNCFCKRQQNSMAETEIVWPAKPEYSLLVPVQKMFANLCCRNPSREASKNSLEVVFFSRIIDAIF